MPFRIIQGQCFPIAGFSLFGAIKGNSNVTINLCIDIFFALSKLEFSRNLKVLRYHTENERGIKLNVNLHIFDH